MMNGFIMSEATAYTIMCVGVFVQFGLLQKAIKVALMRARANDAMDDHNGRFGLCIQSACIFTRLFVDPNGSMMMTVCVRMR